MGTSCASSEKVKDVAQRAAIGFVNLGEFAASAGYGGELAVLDVENFGQEAAGRPELTGLVLVVCALGAFKGAGSSHRVTP